MKNINRFSALGFTMLALLAMGCEKTASQKVEDKVEDAAHETGQAMERAGEKVKDAVN